jgi:hypothetical protein
MTALVKKFFATQTVASIALLACAPRTYSSNPLSTESDVPGFEILMDSGLAGTVDSLALLASLGRIKEAYERIFPPLKGVITVELQNEKCDRVGFDFDSGNLRFCNQSGVIAMGTRSADVLARETFAALFCRSYRLLCSPLNLQRGDLKRFVLGAGEYFAHSQKPDTHFGEGFFEGKPFVSGYGDREKECESSAADEAPFFKVMIDAKYTLVRLRQEVEAPLFVVSQWMGSHKVCSSKSSAMM